MKSDDSWGDEEPPSTLESDSAGLDALVMQFPVADGSGTDEMSWADRYPGVVDEHARPDRGVFFTVSTPSGALSATATLGGGLRHVEVRDVSRLDESGLGQEIVELGTLARDRARAAQHEVTVELMGRRGQDRANVSALLESSLDLPTYDATSERMAAAFAEHYRSDDD